MQDTMLLDRRTKDLVREYVPEGDVLDSIVCHVALRNVQYRVLFFDFRRPDAGQNVVGARDFGNVRDRSVPRARNKSDHGFAPA